MIDRVVDNLYFGLKSLRHAQKHLEEQDVALQGFISASNYFNTFKDSHKLLYDWIIQEYDKVHQQYINTYIQNNKFIKLDKKDK
jgi:hypothetical protein